MHKESIFTALLAAAAFLKYPIGDVAAQALELATAKPESLIRKALLVEESRSSRLEREATLQALVKQLARLLPVLAQVRGQHVQITGHEHRLQVAGRDLVTTTKHVSRNTITPDGRHVTIEQRAQLQAVSASLPVGSAARMLSQISSVPIGCCKDPTREHRKVILLITSTEKTEGR